MPIAVKRFAFALMLLGSASAACAQQAPQQGIPAFYPTRAEAEAAARKHFNCTGAHPIGSQWMPCAGHVPGASNGAGGHGAAP